MPSASQHASTAHTATQRHAAASHSRVKDERGLRDRLYAYRGTLPVVELSRHHSRHKPARDQHDTHPETDRGRRDDSENTRRGKGEGSGIHMREKNRRQVKKAKKWVAAGWSYKAEFGSIPPDFSSHSTCFCKALIPASSVGAAGKRAVDYQNMWEVGLGGKCNSHVLLRRLFPPFFLAEINGMRSDKKKVQSSLVFTPWRNHLRSTS